MLGKMDYTLAKLIYLPAFQNQGALADYLDPYISWWTDEFIKDGLTKETREKILKEFDEEDLEEIVRNQPSLNENGGYDFEKQLLLEWAGFIERDPKKLEIVGKDLHEYFFWKDNPADFYGWQATDEMPKSPEEALEWCKEIWPEIFL